MKTIAVVCEKGGTGKSVIANELYESYVRQGVPASLYSLDGQYKDASSSKKVEDAEVAIVDTPGVLTDNLSDLVSGADVIVIPDAERHRAVHANGLYRGEEHECPVGHRGERDEPFSHVRVVHDVA